MSGTMELAEFDAPAVRTAAFRETKR